MGELLCGEKLSFDPDNTLLRKDIWFIRKEVDGKKRDIVCVRLKSTKESRAYCRGQVIEVFDIPGRNNTIV